MAKVLTSTQNAAVCRVARQQPAEGNAGVVLTKTIAASLMALGYVREVQQSVGPWPMVKRASPPRRMGLAVRLTARGEAFARGDQW